MGEGIARTLGLRMGDSFTPRPGLPPTWTLVGVLTSGGSPFDSEIWAKREEVGRYFGKDNEERKQSFFTSVVVRTPSFSVGTASVKSWADFDSAIGGLISAWAKALDAATRAAAATTRTAHTRDGTFMRFAPFVRLAASVGRGDVRSGAEARVRRAVRLLPYPKQRYCERLRTPACRCHASWPRTPST